MWTRRALLGSAGVLLQRQVRPNILFLLTDDQRWDTLGAMGNRLIRTPHLDELAGRGVTFENNFVTTAICMTSRASIFTGQYARRHGIHDFAKPFTPAQMAGTYPSLLRRSGYWTGFIGKYGVGNRMPEREFDVWHGFPGQGKYFPEGEPGPHLTARMGDQALNFVNRAPSDRPWCLSVSFKAPHVQDEDPRQFLASPETAKMYDGVTIPTPETAHPRFIAALPPEVQRSEGRRRWAVRFGTPALFQESVKRYYRLISEVDTVVGRLRAELRRRGQESNTVIVFTGDNGFYLGEHGLAGKWLMHEESIRTPLIVHDPRLGPAAEGRRRQEMTLNIDLAPTVLDAAGLTPPSSMNGRSLYGLLRGGTTDWRGDWYYEHRFTANGWIPQTEGVRTARWKYTLYPDTASQFEELFDLTADPREKRNLAGSPQARDQLRRLREHTHRWRTRLDTWPVDHAWTDPDEVTVP